MKILHIADVHLGVKINKLPKDKSALMKDEMIFEFNNLFENANSFDIILICGDLFNSKQVSMKLLKSFYDAVKTFGKPVLYVEGNHDEKFIFDESKPSNFIVLNNSYNCFTLNGVNFYCDSDIEKLNKEETNVLLLHGNIDNSFDRDYVDINQYAQLGFDYIALGHIHQYQKRKILNTLTAYSGSLFSCGFDECGDKGYVSVDIDENKQVTAEFVPFAKRRFIICQCDITGFGINNDVIKAINLKFEANDVKKEDIIRVVLKGKILEDNNISVPFIKNYFEDYFYIEIENQTTLEIDFDKIKSEKLSFKYEFISLVENSELSEDEKNAVCKIGIEALKGEDLSI